MGSYLQDILLKESKAACSGMLLKIKIFKDI